MKKTIKIVASSDPKFLFISDSGLWAVVVGVISLIEGGTPQVPDERRHSDRDQDATYVGVVSDEMEEGELNLDEYGLPPEAMKMVGKPSKYELLEGYEEDDETVQEWDFIVEQMIEGEEMTFEAIRAKIEINYAGRGPAFEVPSRDKILDGLDDLIEAGIVDEL